MDQQDHSRYLPGYKPSQIRHHEWRTAENSAAYLLPTLAAMEKQKPNLALLDVGTGSGTIAASLARYIPDGHVTATDLSDEILPRSRSLAASAGVANITFRQASAYNLPFPDGSFDVTHAHQVLCHLDAPWDALREMLRVTRPGGVVAVRESDLKTWCYWPDLEGVRRFHRVLIETHQSAGGSSEGGRRLVSWAVRAGAPREHITASYGTWCYSAPEDRKVWGETIVERIRNGEMRKRALDMGITSEEELDEMVAGWEAWMKADDASLGMIHGELLIGK